MWRNTEPTLGPVEGGRGRRRTSATLVLVVAFAMVACDRDQGSFEDPVAIGPGSEAVPPAEEILDAEPDAEPEWLERVPAVVEPSASQQARAAAFDIAGSAGLTSPPTEAPTGTTDEPSASEATYAGTMNIEIAYYNYCVTYDGNLAYAGSAQYEMAAEVYLNPPAEEAGVSERSPFNLIVATEFGVEGTILLMSGQVVTNDESGENVLIDYWDIDQSETGDISGVLTDRWPGLAFNYVVTAQPIVPCQPDLVLALKDDIAEGAELVGSVTEDQVHIEILAQSLDREVRFFAIIDADRLE